MLQNLMPTYAHCSHKCRLELAYLLDDRWSRQKYLPPANNNINNYYSTKNNQIFNSRKKLRYKCLLVGRQRFSAIPKFRQLEDTYNITHGTAIKISY